MPTAKANKRRAKLPSAFEALVREMPPQAIVDEIQYDNTLVMVDRLMSAGRLSPGQSLYLETLVQLVQAYEAAHHAIETADLSGLATLKYLMAENHMSGSDLARLLGVHVSLGSKLLSGERALTLGHIKKLAMRFKVNATAFID